MNENLPAQVPLLELVRDVPRDLRASWPIQWSEDGLHETGHAMAPIGRYVHELADEVESLRAQLAEARAFAEQAAAAHNALLENQRILTCAFCGQAYPPGTPPTQHDALTAHVLVCPSHPMRAVEAQLAEAQRETRVARCRADTLEDYATSRLCSDHRDKWPRGTCVMCELEKAQREIGKLRMQVLNGHTDRKLLEDDRDRLREFVAAFDAWAETPSFGGAPCDAMLEKRAAVGD